MCFYLQGEPFVVKTGTLGFSITIFTITAVLAILLLLARRSLSVFGKGELGGPTVPRYVSSIFLLLLWLLYVLLSALDTYDYISGF